MQKDLIYVLIARLQHEVTLDFDASPKPERLKLTHPCHVESGGRLGRSFFGRIRWTAAEVQAILVKDFCVFRFLFDMLNHATALFNSSDLLSSPFCFGSHTFDIWSSQMSFGKENLFKKTKTTTSPYYFFNVPEAAKSKLLPSLKASGGLRCLARIAGLEPRETSFGRVREVHGEAWVVDMCTWWFKKHVLGWYLWCFGKQVDGEEWMFFGFNVVL